MKYITKHMITNDAAHMCMRDLSKANSKYALVCKVIFKDGSEDIETFERAQKQVEYLTPDGEIYSQDFDSNLFKEPFFSDKDLTERELKQGYEGWLISKSSESEISSIKWGRIK